MIQTFTNNDVLRYAYNETTEIENIQIQDMLSHEPEMLSYYIDLLDMQLQLTDLKLQPSERLIQNILSYSANHPVSSIRAN